MKSAIYPSLALAAVLSFASCGYESPKYKALKAHTDSIAAVQQSLARDVQEYLYVFDHIGQSAGKIMNKEADHVQQIKTKLNNENNARVNDNIAKLNTLLQANQEEMEALKKQASRNAFRATKLQREVDRVKALLEEECAKTATLQAEVAAQDSTIAALDNTLKALNTELADAKKKLGEQKELIDKYEDELFTGYYIAGKKSVLKQKAVLAGGCQATLFAEGADKKDLTKVNILETTSIKLPDNVKGKLLSSHPKASYKLTKENGEKTLEITDAEAFWSITKYLVIR